MCHRPRVNATGSALIVAPLVPVPPQYQDQSAQVHAREIGLADESWTTGGASKAAIASRRTGGLAYSIRSRERVHRKSG